MKAKHTDANERKRKERNSLKEISERTGKEENKKKKKEKKRKIYEHFDQHFLNEAVRGQWEARWAQRRFAPNSVRL